MKKFIVSYSCGKDSTLALYRMIKAGFEPSGLLVTMNSKEGKSWFHGISADLLQRYSDALGIPLIPIYIKEGEDYGNCFQKALSEAKNIGIDTCVFGDIDIEDHRKWCTERCEAVGIGAHFPLWQENRESLVHEFIDSGFQAMIKVVNLDWLPLKFLEKTLTKEVVDSIKNYGADPCGENGEYHTFVYDGPIFKKPIPFKIGDRTIQHEKYGILNID
ncbi:MAG: diphthine--ammonia ligase [Fusobacteriaceae bacterium]